MSLIVSIYAFSSLISQAVMSVGAAVVVVVALARRDRPQWMEYRSFSSYWRVTALLALACFLSLVGLQFFPVKILEPVRVSWGKDLAKLWYFAWAPFLAVLLSRIPDGEQRQIWKTWFVTVGVLSIVGVIQFFVGWPRPQSIPDSNGRFHATLFLGHHLSVASIFIFPFFASLGAALFDGDDSELRNRTGLSRKTLVVISILSAVTLFLGFSRMLWIALPVGLALFGWLRLSPSRRWSMGLAGLIVLILSCSALYQVPVVRARVEQGIGIGTRFDLWKANVELFLERPLLGVGWHHNLELAGQVLRRDRPGEEVFVGHAHNNFLDVLGSMGALGVIAWLLWNLWLFLELWRLGMGEAAPDSWARNMSRAWLAAFLVFHLNGLTQVNFWEGKVQHQLFWMMAWVLYWRRQRTSTLASATTQ